MQKPDKTKKGPFVRRKQGKKGGDREALTRSGRPVKKAHPPFWGEAKKWYILFGLSVIISVLLFPNILAPPKLYKLGDVADRDIKASHEFLIENRELTEKDRQEAVKAVLSVYDFDPTSGNLVSRVQLAFKEGRQFLTQTLAPGGPGNEAPPKKEGTPGGPFTEERFFELLDIPVDHKAFDILVKNGFPKEAEEAIIGLAMEVLKDGMVSNKNMLMSQGKKGIILHDIHTEKDLKVSNLDRFNDRQQARRLIEGQYTQLSKTLGSEALARVSIELAIDLIRPNLTFNKRETELRKDLARKSAKPSYFKVKKGEMLVREGERIKPEHLLKLSEQHKYLRTKQMLGRAPAMALLIGFFLSAMYLVGFITRRSSGSETKDLLFIAVSLLAIFLVVMASNFMSEEIARGFKYFNDRTLLYAIPVASGAMLIAIFQGMGIAASFSLIISVLASLAVDGRVEFFLYFFISSLVAAYGVQDCRERGIFIKTGLKVSACNMVVAFSIETLYGSFYGFEGLLALASAFVGGMLVGVIATGILPVIEMAFGYTSDIKLLELASLDQPLLRDLMVRAPGTYHHSVMVSHMVEATAKAINANPLLAKVAAYYHDIGKLKKPLYFVENQGDCENKHEKLAPSMSSLILISHIKDGVELAKKHKLGREIIDIIRQHHGTSLITYFYEKAKEQGEKKAGKSPKIKEEDFRYPGPKPQTKEAGLVMLADVVEAASRSLVDPTAARIQGMVQKIINKVFSDGQLDECELTLKDLHEIAKSFNKTLSGIFHHRVDYPEPVARMAASRQGTRSGEMGAPLKKGENGNTNHLSPADSSGKKPEDRGENGESLKRLGLS